ncbi:MAG: type VI secretion system contractile sheath large subunit [Phycisphaerae bacterium]|nr:type VI secretion system contractile sheath large subunit [Phycisphaerae bacterium]
MSDDAMKFDVEVDFPMPGGLKISTEKPYRILVVGDFAGSDKGTVTGAMAGGGVEINSTNFDEILGDARPSVSFTLADPVAGGNQLAEAGIRVASIRDFDPIAMAGQINATASLFEIREKLVGRLMGKLSGEQLAQSVSAAIASDSRLSWLSEWLKAAPAAKPADPATVNKLLDGLDLGDSAAAPSTGGPRSAIGAAVAGAAGASGIPAEESAAVRRTLNEVDRIISAWLNTVLHSAEVQPMEAIWRSIAFLVRHIDFRKNVRLQLLHAHRHDLTTRFTSKVIDPVFDDGADAPDLVILASSFGNTSSDMEVLDEMAQHAASLPAVILAPVSPAFFGVKHAWQVPTLPALVNMFDQWQFAKWKGLREQTYARLLGVVFGRGLLRQPHGRDDLKDLEFSFKEDASLESSFLWAEGVFAAALTIARSVTESGWPSGMSGYVRGQVDGFASAMGGKDGKKKYGPSDLQMVQSKIEEIGGAGINVVVGAKDQEFVHFWNGVSAARPGSADISGVLEVSLPYQLFAARLSGLLFDLKPSLSAKSEDQVASIVKGHVQNWLQLPDDLAAQLINVQVRPAEKDPSSLELALTTTPPPTILPGGVPVVLGYRIAR